jgi:hypothetical protein
MRRDVEADPGPGERAQARVARLRLERGVGPRPKNRKNLSRCNRTVTSSVVAPIASGRRSQTSRPLRFVRELADATTVSFVSSVG